MSPISKIIIVREGSQFVCHDLESHNAAVIGHVQRLTYVATGDGHNRDGSAWIRQTTLYVNPQLALPEDIKSKKQEQKIRGIGD